MKALGIGLATALVSGLAAPVLDAQKRVAPVWSAESNQASARLGFSVSAAGDVDGDGFADVIVGASSYGNTESGEGRAFLYRGGKYGLSKHPSWSADGGGTDANLGQSVSGAGDVNGDGYDDVIVGVPGQVRARVYLGSGVGLEPSPSWTATQAQPSFGFSVAGAGDVNGDGYDDVLIGASGYTNGQVFEGGAYLYLGSAAGLGANPAWTAEANQVYAGFGVVGPAGDVNGDGYDDVVVGSPFYDNGQIDEGAAFLYLGSAAGLAPTPAWSVEGSQGFAQLGMWVRTAGDVNGDGFSDVIVGVVGFSRTTGEGRALVYHGLPSGLSTSAAWTATGGQPVAEFGVVSGAGDLDGDGYGDVIVGAYGFDHEQMEEGRVLAYYGSATGLSAQPLWFAESNQKESQFGFALSAAGDVDGDGFSDVIVGAYDFDDGQTNEGAAFVYRGATRVRMRTPFRR